MNVLVAEPETSPAERARPAVLDLPDAPEPLGDALGLDDRPPIPAGDVALADGASLYLQELSKTPLLTAEQEVVLAQQYERGRDARARLALANLNATVDPALDAVVRAGDAARERLVEANLRLVIAVARKYLNRGLAFLDLVQEGNVGLQRAVDGFDWRRGFRFSTYAYWWIRQAISRALALQARSVRLPVHVLELLGRVQVARQALYRELEREPSAAELGARVGTSAQRVAEVLQAARDPASLDAPVGDDGEWTLADTVPDPTSEPAEVAERNLLSQALATALQEQLTPREATILRLRYGLGTDAPHARRQVATELGLSCERVRQLEGEAFRKLRRAQAFRQHFGAYV